LFRSDAAAFCKARILGNLFPVQDPDMAHGVGCAQLPPAVQGGDFPQAWRDTARHHRGTASHGRSSHYVPTSIGTRAITAMIAYIFERVLMEVGA
jgi:hypothetical protein